MLVLFILIVVIYFLNKINSSKLDLPKIRKELVLVSEEASTDLQKNETIIQTYSKLKLELSSEMDDIRKKENLSEPDLIRIGNDMKIIAEIARKYNSSMIPKSRAGSTYAFLLWADEIIKIAKDREIALKGIVSLSAEIIALSFNNTSENIIYEKIQYLTKVENALNVINGNMYFKMNCVQDLINK